MLIASASPRNGSTFRRRSFASNETGGVISAVMTNRPARSFSCRFKQSGGGGCAMVMFHGRDGASGDRVVRNARYISGGALPGQSRGPPVKPRPWKYEFRPPVRLRIIWRADRLRE